MTAELAAGKVKLVGGRLCLDFVNTVSPRAVSNQPLERERGGDYLTGHDKLTSYPALVAWSTHAGLLSDKEARRLLRSAGDQTKSAEVVLKRAVRLREAIYRIFRAKLTGRLAGEADLRALNEELSIAKDHERLVAKADGFAFEWDVPGVSLDRMLWPLARSASEVLTSDELDRVRQCGGENCGWLFLDTSRNRSRQWCDMRDCGNLAKVRRFRQRQQEKQ
jgi:predicted RNA-binding Zn ribbon-like protein